MKFNTDYQVHHRTDWQYYASMAQIGADLSGMSGSSSLGLGGYASDHRCDAPGGIEKGVVNEVGAADRHGRPAVAEQLPFDV